MNWPETSVLVTGGTGSFGRKFVAIALAECGPRKLVIYSRDEMKQHEMRQAGFDDDRLRYFIGDVRDVDRLRRALNGIDVVVHAAALKQVPACEYNPIEAVAKNVVDAALDMGVSRVLALSTDKAVNPVNLYGATKLVAEKLFVQANSYRGTGPTRFSCVRYGNVAGSRGSVIPLFAEQRGRGKVTLTNPRMTRFWITIEEGVRFVLRSIERMHGGEVFVPKIPSASMLDLARAVAPGCEVETIGVRPGEKMHECLISEDESADAVELDGFYVIQPRCRWWAAGNWSAGAPVPQGFRYSSDSNPARLSPAGLRALVAPWRPPDREEEEELCAARA
jgi:UDP-N-acetylglucosamine 4,6-dehydratase